MDEETEFFRVHWKTSVYLSLTKGMTHGCFQHFRDSKAGKTGIYWLLQLGYGSRQLKYLFFDSLKQLVVSSTPKAPYPLSVKTCTCFSSGDVSSLGMYQLCACGGLYKPKSYFKQYTKDHSTESVTQKILPHVLLAASIMFCFFLMTGLATTFTG